MSVEPQFERRTVHFGGHVQGVGFRFTARAIAARHPVSGFVQNLPDGRVRMVVEGSSAALEAFVAELAGEMDRYIESSDVRVQPATQEFREFEIRR